MLGKTDNKELIKAGLLKLALICGIGIVAIFIICVVDHINYANNGERDFSTLPQSEMKDGLFVKGYIDTAIGPYAEDGDDTNSDNSSGAYYYLVPVYSQEKNVIDHFVSYKADGQSDKDAMEKIVQNTADGTNSETLKIEHGLMVSLASDQKSILEDWVKADDFSDGGSLVDYCINNKLMDTTDKDVIMSRILTFSINRTDYAALDYINIIYPAIPGIFALAALFIMKKTEEAKKKQAAERSKYDINQLM